MDPLHDQAFENVKEALSSPAPLRRPDPTKPFILQTDASGVGMAAVLFQPREDGGRNIVAYQSARFNATERRYHINEQECLAIIWAIKRWRPYLEDTRFTIRTDNKALTWLQKTKDSRAKLTRWALLLQQFTFDIEHCRGSENELPDILSRNPSSPASNHTDDLEQLLPPERPLPLANHEAPEALACVLDVTTLPDEIAEAQRHDRDTQNLVRLVQRANENLNPREGVETLPDLTVWRMRFCIIWKMINGVSTFQRTSDQGFTTNTMIRFVQVTQELTKQFAPSKSCFIGLLFAMMSLRTFEAVCYVHSTNADHDIQRLSFVHVFLSVPGRQSHATSWALIQQLRQEIASFWLSRTCSHAG